MQHLWLAAGLAARAYDASSEIVQSHLAKRDGGHAQKAITEGVAYVILAAINIIPIVFILLYLTYTLGSLIPTLAIAESHAPPEYQQVPHKPDDEWAAGGRSDGGIKNELSHDEEDVLAGDASRIPLYAQQPNSTCSVKEPAALRRHMSIRRLHRSLWRVNGLRSMFHGLVACECYQLAVGVVTLAVSAVPLVGVPLGYITGSLAAVQLALRLTHRQLAAPEPERVARPAGGAFMAFTAGLPPFRATLRAAALPTLLVLAAHSIVLYVSAWVASATTHAPLLFWNGFVMPGSLKKGVLRVPDNTAAVYCVLQLVLVFLLEIPATVVITRIQVALLADNNVRTVVPVDRTFGVAGGLFAAERDGSRRGWLAASWLSVVAAFRSFKGQWVDLYILLLKTVGIMIAIETAVLGIWFLEVMLYIQTLS